MLFVIVSTLLVVASFGMESLDDAFDASAERDGGSYDSTLQAFWFLLYAMTDKGNMRKTLGAATPGDERYIERLFFDVGIFLWISVILFSSISAIIVDAVNQTRGNRAAAAAMRSAIYDTCFICGLTKGVYENYGVKRTDLGPAATWDDHRDKHHNILHYAHFVLHVRHKHDVKREKLSGVEAFVLRKIRSNDDKTSWVPFRTSYDLQRQGLGTAGQRRRGGDGEEDGMDDGAPSGLSGNAVLRSLQLKQETLAEEQKKMMALLSKVVHYQQQQQQQQQQQRWGSGFFSTRRPSDEADDHSDGGGAVAAVNV